MGFKFGLDFSLKGLRIETGAGDRVIGVQADQTILKQEDLDKAKVKIEEGKAKLKEGWERTKDEVRKAKAKVEEARAAKKAASQQPVEPPVEVVPTPS